MVLCELPFVLEVGSDIDDLNDELDSMLGELGTQTADALLDLAAAATESRSIRVQVVLLEE